MTSIAVTEPSQSEIAPISSAVEITEGISQAREGSRPWLALAALVALGSVSGIAYYLGFVRPYSMQNYYHTPLLDLAKINGHTPASANAWALTWIVLFTCYYLAFRLCPSSANASRTFSRTAITIVCVWAAFFCINLIFMYPVGAADIFDYIFRGRMVAQYNLNPFTNVPGALPGDLFMPYIAWPSEPSHYGPVWELLAGGASLLAGDNFWNNLIIFKALVLVAHAINIALVYHILRLIRPEWTLRGVLFFAWNPLLIFEIAGNGHHESVVATFMLAAIYLFVSARRVGVLPAIMLGALTKFIPLLIALPALTALWRDRVHVGARPQVAGEDVDTGAEEQVKPRLLSQSDVLFTIGVGGIIALMLAGALYIPFWEGPRSIGALYMGSLFTASLPKVTLDWLVFDIHMRQDIAEALVKYTALALTALVTLGLSLSIVLRQSAHTLHERMQLINRTLRAFYEIMFVYLAFSTLWFQPWYLVWLIALTAPLASYTYAHRTLLFCIGGVLNYFVFDYIWLWNHAATREIQVTSALVVYTLPLGYTLYTFIKRQDAKVTENAKFEDGRFNATLPGEPSTRGLGV